MVASFFMLHLDGSKYTGYDTTSSTNESRNKRHSRNCIVFYPSSILQLISVAVDFQNYQI